ncbi:hypothetical protein MASR2M70_02980 [Bacillota bacterium]
MIETEDVEGRYILKVGVHETRLQNEAWLDIWYENSEVTQHVHSNACETFYIINGEVELIVSGGIRTVLKQGDIFHCPPGMGHKFHTLGKHAAWYNLFANLHYWNIVQTEIDMSIHYPDKIKNVNCYRNFISSMNSQKLSPYPPVRREEDHHWVRRAGTALLNFEAFGIRFNLKVAPWETNELNEIWELEIKKGTKIKLNEPFNFWQTYIFQEGSAKCKVGGESFISIADDFVQIHPYQPMDIEFIEDSRLLSWGSGYKLLPLLDEIYYNEQEDPNRLNGTYSCKDIIAKYKVPFFEIE